MQAARPKINSLAIASAFAAFFAGILTAFTVSVGGEMPLGEIVLMAVFGWIAAWAIVTGSFPAEVPRSRIFRIFLVCQAVAFVAYVVSDLYRHSSPHDMGRGWARMVFLAIDIVSVAYLFGCSRLNLLMLLFGQLAGDALHALILGALYGDLWKFGVGIPLTYLVFFLASFMGRAALVIAAFAMSALHFALDYRSFGGICLVVGTATLVTLFPLRVRKWLIIPGVMVIAGGLFAYSFAHRGSYRATRSDLSRTSMLIAAYQGFRSSPVIGQGSWFSRSPVFNNFMAIRAEAAKADHVGGFPEANEDPGTVAIHSQILVALAEGGIFGATFFIVFGFALIEAICRITFALEGSRFTGIYLLILFTALFNWFLSPFSGAHRVYIAIACGLILYLQRSRLALPSRSTA
jgi:hypothetical protein